MCKFVTNALGMTPKMPAIPTIPATPAVQQAVAAPSPATDPGPAADAAEAERRRVAAMKGRASTVLTSGAGDTTAVSVKAPVATGTKTLLGG